MGPKIAQGLTLYFSLLSAPCRAVLLTLKHLNIDLPPGGLKKINIHERTENQDPWFEKINYEKVVPTIIDNGFILWESRAIIKYLVQKYAPKEIKGLYPTDLYQQAYVDRLLYFDQGVLSKSISNYFKPQIIYKETPNPLLGCEIERSLQLLGKLFSKKNAYLAGGTGGNDTLTIADISILTTLTMLESMDYSYETHERVTAYVKFVKGSLTSYEECCQEGVNLAQKWARKEMKYVPAYLRKPGLPYDDEFYEHTI